MAVFRIWRPCESHEPVPVYFALCHSIPGFIRCYLVVGGHERVFAPPVNSFPLLSLYRFSMEEMTENAGCGPLVSRPPEPILFSGKSAVERGKASHTLSVTTPGIWYPIDMILRNISCEVACPSLSHLNRTK